MVSQVTAQKIHQKTAVKLEESTKHIDELMQERAGFEQTITSSKADSKSNGKLIKVR
jgi:hypothetical protein